MDVGFKLKLKTPKGIIDRIDHHVVSQWLLKHNLKMKFNRIDQMWEITTSVTDEEWEELYKIIG